MTTNGDVTHEDVPLVVSALAKGFMSQDLRRAYLAWAQSLDHKPSNEEAAGFIAGWIACIETHAL